VDEEAQDFKGSHRHGRGRSHAMRCGRAYEPSKRAAPASTVLLSVLARLVRTGNYAHCEPAEGDAAMLRTPLFDACQDCDFGQSEWIPKGRLYFFIHAAINIYIAFRLAKSSPGTFVSSARLTHTTPR
jgi:hypothetical protein